MYSTSRNNEFINLFDASFPDHLLSQDFQDVPLFTTSNEAETVKKTSLVDGRFDQRIDEVYRETAQDMFQGFQLEDCALVELGKRVKQRIKSVGRYDFIGNSDDNFCRKFEFSQNRQRLYSFSEIVR